MPYSMPDEILIRRYGMSGIDFGFGIADFGFKEFYLSISDFGFKEFYLILKITIDRAK